MNPLGHLFCSTIGRKVIMAVTGIVLIGFVIGHLVGNLQVFEEPDRINGYAQFLHTLGPVLWVMRITLLVCAGLHIWAAIVLTIEDRKARGAVDYRTKTWIQATLSSRYMRWTGYVVLAFVIYHLAQFTLGSVQSASYKENLPEYTMNADYHVMGIPVVHAGTHVHDVRSMVILGFSQPIVAFFYIFAVGLLSLHLLHGAQSLFQTLGLRNSSWGKALRAIVTLACLAYFLGNLAIPGAVLTGHLKLNPASASSTP
ncbi:MAG: succinate dehydrogenase cytochrome b subunit [Verrucomicrobiota bacterium]|nr:MAG: succinate dehydrogenase cytochrome b subunit [Verrucomicrobiota bacterium]